MPLPPKKNSAYIFYTSLIDQSNTKVFKSGPTMAAGDFKVSTDGAAYANLATLPTNTPSGTLIKVSLSAGEMNGDNVSVSCIDAAGAEWCDQLINIQTSTRQVDDLSFPATSGRSSAIDASGYMTCGTNNDKTGYSLSGAAIQAFYDTLTSALTTVGSIGKLLVDNINATISSRSSYAGGDTPGTTTLLSRLASVLTLTGGKVDINDKTGFSISGTKTTLDALNDVSNANVLTQVNSALDTAGSELSVVPTTTGTIRQKLNFLFEYFRNKKTVTGSTETLMKEDASTTLGTSSLSDDGTTFTKGEMN